MGSAYSTRHMVIESIKPFFKESWGSWNQIPYEIRIQMWNQFTILGNNCCSIRRCSNADVLGPPILNPERLDEDDVEGTDEELLCRLLWEEVWNWSDGEGMKNVFGSEIVDLGGGRL